MKQDEPRQTRTPDTRGWKEHMGGDKGKQGLSPGFAERNFRTQRTERKNKKDKKAAPGKRSMGLRESLSRSNPFLRGEEVPS